MSEIGFAAAPVEKEDQADVGRKSGIAVGVERRGDCRLEHFFERRTLQNAVVNLAFARVADKKVKIFDHIRHGRVQAAV